MNLRKEHRKEQGEAAQRDFEQLWNGYLLRKAKSFGVLQLNGVKHIAKLAFLAGAFAEFREHIGDDD